jgi:hypothetical protein
MLESGSTIQTVSRSKCPPISIRLLLWVARSGNGVSLEFRITQSGDTFHVCQKFFLSQEIVKVASSAFHAANPNATASARALRFYISRPNLCP